MNKVCYVKRGSKPPVCEIHKVPLVQRHTTQDQMVGIFTYLACPVSGHVVK